MRKIHSKVLAVITSICLIHAADPPYAKSSGLLPQNAPVQKLVFQPSPAATTEKSILFQPAHFDHIEVLIHSSRQGCNQGRCDDDDDDEKHQDPGANETSLYHTINRLMRQRGKTQYEKLKEKDFVKPLLKLYATNETYIPPGDRISKEDRVEDITTLSKEELDLLLHNHEVYQSPDSPLSEIDQQSLRRRDDGVSETGQQEHIGEILRPNYQEHQVRSVPNRRAASQRKSYDVTFPSTGYETIKYRTPFAFQREETKYNFDYDYPPSSSSAEGYDGSYHQRDQQQFRSSRYVRLEGGYDQVTSANTGQYQVGDFPGYRFPGRQRGYRDVLQDTTQRQNVWPSARKPRVIFPTDLVSFREPGQDEADWLASDTNLQDLQQETQDRGMISNVKI